MLRQQAGNSDKPPKGYPGGAAAPAPRHWLNYPESLRESPNPDDPATTERVHLGPGAPLDPDQFALPTCR